MDDAVTDVTLDDPLEEPTAAPLATADPVEEAT